jgi:hypothetical protein
VPLITNGPAPLSPLSLLSLLSIQRSNQSSSTFVRGVTSVKKVQVAATTLDRTATKT